MSYHTWNSLARCKGAEASIIWIREVKAGADSHNEDGEHEKPQEWAQCNFEMPTLGWADAVRSGENALEAAKKPLEGNKVN